MRQFGDVDVTVLLDVSVPFIGLEAATAHGISQLVEMPGSGRCSVHLRRLGIDQRPVTLTGGIGAGHLKQVTYPMQWIDWWKRIEASPHHIVVLVVHELCDYGHADVPKRCKLLPLALAVGVSPDLVSKFSFIPEAHVMHVPPDRVARGWRAVYDAVERTRCIPDPGDPRLLSKLAFTTDDHNVVDTKTPDAAYARYIGYPRTTLVQQQLRVMLPHVR